MSKSKKETKKRKRKEKQKKIKKGLKREAAIEKSDYFYFRARDYVEAGNPEKALASIKKAARLSPNDPEILGEMGHIGMLLNDVDLQLRAFNGLKALGLAHPELWFDIALMLARNDRYTESLSLIREYLAFLPEFDINNKRERKKQLKDIEAYCQYHLALQESPARVVTGMNTSVKNVPQKRVPETAASDAPAEQTMTARAPAQSDTPPAPPEIPFAFHLDSQSFYDALLEPEPAGPECYRLAVESHEIRFKESFEHLIALTGLANVRSLWYQEETARKVMKQFRGRALLSDEVGLGKTIEALMVFAEYIKRGMARTGLILTPTPLVSQWKEELESKFGLDIPSTDDPDFKSKGEAFWDAPFVLSSINQAKSKKNFQTVADKKYDIVIVDEAHHLKNRNTLNWKLVNALKKKFILLLTATPVENNLMELYNLITLLKPGQLETATAFREKFMQKGDPTGPRNRALLKELLGEVMIRNTRALAGINIPPRFAETIRITPSKTERALYEKLETLVMALNQESGGKGKLVLKNLLAQAGSSPRALERSIDNMLAKTQYLLAHENALRAVKNLCRTTLDTPKNMALHKLVRSTPEKMIVFVKYIGTLEHLSEFLEWNAIDHAVFHGSMDNARKNAEIEDFRNKKQILLTTEIGGEGRNLQFCSRMVNYDLPWNPMKIEQRIGRIHRIGQEKEVRIFNFCAAETVEDYILDVLDRKINMFEMVIGEIDMIVGRLRGEKDFSEMIFDLWVDAKTPEERKKAFDNLGTRLKRAKTGYEKTRELDEQLFGDNYEL